MSAKIAIVGVFLIVLTITGWVTTFFVIFSCAVVTPMTTIPLVVTMPSVKFQPRPRRRVPLFNNIDDSMDCHLSCIHC